jgi:predicted phage-related endonuclease
MSATVPAAFKRPYKILVADATSPAWLPGRKVGVGASESAAVLGDSQWGTARTVFNDKTSDIVTDIGTPLMEFGHLAEPLVVSYMENHPELYGFVGEIVPSEGLLQSVEWPWLLGTLDRQIRTPEGALVPLEIKSLGDFVAREWLQADEGGGEADPFGEGPGRGSRAVVPKKYLVQVQQQMAVTGAEFGYVAAWLGKHRLDLIRVERDDEYIDTYLVGKVGDFWKNNVLAGVAPPLVQEDDIWAVYPGNRGQQIVATAEILEVVGKFREAKVDEKLIKAQLKGQAAKAATAKAPAQERIVGLEFQIADFMGDATELVHFGSQEVVHTLRPQATNRTVDWDLLKQEYPDVYEAVVKPPGLTRIHRGTGKSIDVHE